MASNEILGGPGAGEVVRVACEAGEMTILGGRVVSFREGGTGALSTLEYPDTLPSDHYLVRTGDLTVEYDGANQPVVAGGTSTTPSPSTYQITPDGLFTFDEAGHTLSFVDISGQVTSFSYPADLPPGHYLGTDSHGVTEYNQSGHAVSILTAEGLTEFDEGGRPIRFTDLEQQVTTYDNAGRPVMITDADGNVLTQFEYPPGLPAGHYLSIDSRGITEFDGNQHPIKLIEGDTVTYFDNSGQPTIEQGPDGTTYFDDAGRPDRFVGVDQTEDTYDDAGNPLTHTDSTGVTEYGPGGHPVRFTAVDGTITTYDDTGRPLTVKDDTGTTEFGANGQPGRFTANDGTVTTYDFAGRPVTVTDNTGQVITSYEYPPGLPAGHYLRIDDDGQWEVGPGDRVFRLTESDGTVTTYSEAGVRTSQFEPDKGTTTFGPSGKPTTFVGLDGSITTFDGNGRPVETRDVAGNVIATYEYPPGLPAGHVVKRDGNGLTQYDQNGNPVKFTDGLGNITVYNSQGNPISFTNAAGDTITYDPATGRPVSYRDGKTGITTSWDVVLEEFDLAIATVQSRATDISGEVAQLRTVMSRIQNDWNSPAGGSFESLGSAFKGVAKELEDLLAEAVRRMRTTRANYAESDTVNTTYFS